MCPSLLVLPRVGRVVLVLGVGAGLLDLGGGLLVLRLVAALGLVGGGVALGRVGLGGGLPRLLDRRRGPSLLTCDVQPDQRRRSGRRSLVGEVVGIAGQ